MVFAGWSMDVLSFVITWQQEAEAMSVAIHIARPAYRCEFGPDEVDSIAACNDEHGFAIVRGSITPALVDEIKADIMATLGAAPLAPAEGRCDLAFIEHAPSLMKLLEDAHYMRLQHRLLGSEDLVLHRTAAIIRQPGSPPIGWHTDMPLLPPTPQSANDALNFGEWPNGMWYYLTGSMPELGGLAVIADSHRPDWAPPAGYSLSPNRQFVHRAGDPAVHGGMEVPGTVQLIAAPEDLLVFATRTYHAANQHLGSAPRLSAGIGLRPRQVELAVPWPLPESARRFIAATPPHQRRYVDGYPGIVADWRPEVQAA